MNAIEKLARDICWAGFITPAGRAGKTRAGYWKSIHPEARDAYIQEAERIVWLLFRPGILEAINTVRAERGEISRLFMPRKKD